MPCYHPVPAWPDLSTGRWVFNPDSTRRDLGGQVDTPCRQCIGCRIDRSSEWAMRCEHELKFHDESCFLTLTLDDEHFPTSQDDFVAKYVLGLKRIRRHSPRIRTFGCLELGTHTRRPHGHLLVFGRDFSRDEPVSRGPNGDLVYRSNELDALWGLGHASVGELTRESAGYVARYVVAERSDRAGPVLEAVPHPVSGEPVFLRPAAPWARSQGLGRAWFEQYGRQAIEQGAIVERGGVRRPIPKFYSKLAKQAFPTVGADAECIAQLRALEQAWNRTPERLAVRAEVKRAQLRTLKRGAL